MKIYGDKGFASSILVIHLPILGGSVFCLGGFEMKLSYSVILGVACAAFVGNVVAQDETPEMGFFVTSVGVGNGADLGGLEGADAHCQSLAEAVGSTRTWAAYLSAKPEGRAGAVDARDRIGEGPWHNVQGVLIASSVDSLHYDNSNFTYLNARDENGNTINARSMGNTPNRHDILTGSYMDGTVIDAEDGTCSNWTSSDEGNAVHMISSGPALAQARAVWLPTVGPAVSGLDSAASLMRCFFAVSPQPPYVMAAHAAFAVAIESAFSRRQC